MNEQPLVVQGGIYRYEDDTESNMFFYYRNNSMYLINGPMVCLDMDVDHIGRNLKGYELVEGYALACKKVNENEYQWMIRNSGRKHTDAYILAKGRAGKPFFTQLSQHCVF